MCKPVFTSKTDIELLSFCRSKPDSTLSISLASHSQTQLIDEAISPSSDGNLSNSYQTLILEAYASIGEPDSVYGAGAGRLADVDSRIRTYMHEHAWGKALGRKIRDCTSQNWKRQFSHYIVLLRSAGRERERVRKADRYVGVTFIAAVP